MAIAGTTAGGPPTARPARTHEHAAVVDVDPLGGDERRFDPSGIRQCLLARRLA
jgi:hypothetical protein